VEKARNVLEACAGNVALAAQLYWDDYLASQEHEQLQQAPPDPPPLNAPPAAAAAAAEPPVNNNSDDEERRVRRRLESDFERLLPPQQAEPLGEWLPQRRRRRRRRQEAGEGADPGVVAALVAVAVNAGNVPIDDGPPAAARPRVAGEASVSVSDDETGGLRMVRTTRPVPRPEGRRRRRSNSNSENKAREALYAQLEFAAVEAPEAERRKRYRAAVKRTSDHGGGGGDSSDNSSSGSGNESDDDDDAYLSDNDWVFNPPRNPPAPPDASSTSSQSTQNLRAPLKILWGGLLHSPGAKTETKIKVQDDHEVNAEKCAETKKVKVKKGNDETNDGSEGGPDDSDDEAAANSKPSKSPEIPSTWMHASFSPHATGMGLALKTPKPEDVIEHSWSLERLDPNVVSPQARRNNAIPLPYHCRAISAILSIVTAIMYTGASVQSNQVTLSSSRVPFLELAEEDRLREFETRLVDALSVLIFVAAKASMERKQNALAKKLARKNRKKRQRKERKSSDDGEDLEEPRARQTILERKLKLCPVTWWKENPQGVLNLPEEQWQNSLEDSSHRGPRIELAVSYSNISDIRAYVLSNMQAFTSPGGLALLLETVVGIHGEGAIKRMIEKSRKVDGSCSGTGLMYCTCVERQRDRLKDASLRRKMLSSSDTSPPGNHCMSTELLSLLLTGRVHSSLDGWSTDQLGFGILSHSPNEVGRALCRPEMPVWILKGQTCFSVLLLDYTNHGENLDEEKKSSMGPGDDSKKDNAKKSKHYLGPSKPKAAPSMKMSLCSSTSRSRDLQEAQKFAKLDEPGTIANLAHWNCWFGVRNSSGLRLITARPKWSPPPQSWVLKDYKAAPDAKHSSSLSCVRKPLARQLQERRASLVNVVSCDERDGCNPGPKVDEAAIERVRSNDDDVKFYPNQHRMWRFDMGDKVEADLDTKPRGTHWVPYYSLSRDDQFIVEVKYGPQISSVLWNRWPGATIDKFTPEGKEAHPVV
jgi:hypothetical protein